MNTLYLTDAEAKLAAVYKLIPYSTTSIVFANSGQLMAVHFLPILKDQSVFLMILNIMSYHVFTSRRLESLSWSDASRINPFLHVGKR